MQTATNDSVGRFRLAEPSAAYRLPRAIRAYAEPRLVKYC
jgi:hypothetical protein